jgi:hypothetical protein
LFDVVWLFIWAAGWLQEAPTRFVLTRGDVQHKLRADGIPQRRSPTGWQNRERRRGVPNQMRIGRLGGGVVSSSYFNTSL